MLKYINYLNKYVFLFQKVLDIETNKYGYIKRFDIHNIDSILVLFDDKTKKIYMNNNIQKLYFIF